MTGGRFGGPLEWGIAVAVILALGILPSLVDWVCGR